MDEIEVWKWRAQYEPNAVTFDGGAWSLELAQGGKTVRSSGRNAYPSDEDVTVTGTFLPSEVFKKFHQAVGRLVGKETFP